MNGDGGFGRIMNHDDAQAVGKCFCGGVGKMERFWRSGRRGLGDKLYTGWSDARAVRIAGRPRVGRARCLRLHRLLRDGRAPEREGASERQHREKIYAPGFHWVGAAGLTNITVDCLGTK